MHDLDHHVLADVKNTNISRILRNLKPMYDFFRELQLLFYISHLALTPRLQVTREPFEFVSQDLQWARGLH
jgi:hypothetical protein